MKLPGAEKKEGGYRFMGFFLRLTWQSYVLLCVYVMRDPRAFTRVAVASKGVEGVEVEAVTLSVSSVLPPKVPVLLAFQIL